MQNWQEWRKEIREERRESPVETFCSAPCFSVSCCVLGICCGVYAFFFPYPYDFNCDCGICVMEGISTFMR